MPDFRLGLDAKFYLNSGTLSAAATSLAGLTLTEVAPVRNVTISAERAEADVTTRENDGWEQIVGALKRAEIPVEMRYKPGDTQQESLRDAFMNGTIVGAAILSDASGTANSEGLVGNFSVLKWERTEELEGALMINTTLKPYSNTSWVEVA